MMFDSAKLQLSFSHSLCLSFSQAYQLTDYKQLNLDIKLKGLGPDYKAIEKTVSSDLQCQSPISRNH